MWLAHAKGNLKTLYQYLPGVEAGDLCDVDGLGLTGLDFTPCDIAAAICWGICPINIKHIQIWRLLPIWLILNYQFFQYVMPLSFLLINDFHLFPNPNKNFNSDWKRLKNS